MSMNCSKNFGLSSSITASCVARFMICWVCWLYFSGLICLVLSQDEYLILKLTMDNFVYVFDAWRKWSCGVVCVWPRTNSDTIVIWNDKVKGTVLVSARIFVDKLSTYYLKRWIYGPCACAKLSIVSPFLRVLNN